MKFLLFKFLLCHVDTQESSCKDIAKFNYYKFKFNYLLILIFGKIKGPQRFISQANKGPKMQTFLGSL